MAHHAVSPHEVEEALTKAPLVLRGADKHYLVYGRTENGRWLVRRLCHAAARSRPGAHGTRHDRRRETPLSAKTEGTIMTVRRKMPTFRNDREAADYWAKHDSASYARGLPTAAVKVSPALRRRVAARAKKPVTLRLEQGQIAAARRLAARISLPYQTLLRIWIAERLVKQRAG
jgi:hypothetical protein